ncbi:MAG: NAD(P)/FAD-dependent oxidoreductase, partial [Acidimicrobiia bacterium]
MGRSCDLLVVGGGPAGAAAAIRGAAAGLSVVVCDKASFPRDKTCGDGLTTTALRLLERLGLDPSTVDGWEPVGEVVLRSPSGRIVELPLPTDGLYAAVAPRSTLDAALLDVAARRGAEIRQGAALQSLRTTDSGVEATLGPAVPRTDTDPTQTGPEASADGEALTTRYVVAADGMYSTVRRLTGVDGPHLGEWHAFRQYFTGVADRRLWVFFEPDLL